MTRLHRLHATPPQPRAEVFRVLHFSPFSNRMEGVAMKDLDGVPYLKFRRLADGRDWAYFQKRDPFDPRGNKMLQVPLGATRDDPVAVLVKLGEVLQLIEQGIHPLAGRQKVSQIAYTPHDDRDRACWECGIRPFFGGMLVKDIDAGVIERYIRWRWPKLNRGRDADLVGVRSTFVKEMRCLRRAVGTLYPQWRPPTVHFVEAGRDVKEPLTWAQAQTVAPHVMATSRANGIKYFVGFWIMACTTMEPMDAVQFAPEHIVECLDRETGVRSLWVRKRRSKVKRQVQYIECPVVPKLLWALEQVPKPLDPSQPYLAGTTNKLLYRMVERGFARAGFKGYGSKDLRRMLPSIMRDLGYSDEWIQMILAHAPGSGETRKYTKPYRAAVEQAFTRALGA